MSVSCLTWWKLHPGRVIILGIAAVLLASVTCMGATMDNSFDAKKVAATQGIQRAATKISPAARARWYQVAASPPWGNVGPAAPTPRLMPNVVGMSEAEAIASLRQLDVRISKQGDELSSFGHGRVTRTNPEALMPLARGIPIKYWVASGQNPVPRLRGATEESAARLLRASGFAVGTIAFRESKDGAGRVIATVPEEGTDAPVGSTVALTLNAVPLNDLSLPWVPSVIGLAEPQATRVLQNAGYQFENLGEQPSTLEQGTVIATDPVAGTALPGGAVVRYRLASGQSIVPSLKGLAVAQAQRALITAGFRVGKLVYQYDQGAPGRLLDSSPTSGSQAPIGSAVSLRFSNDQLRVPDVRSMTPAKARLTLFKAGFAVDATVDATAIVAPNHVIGQGPNPGPLEFAPRGTLVRLTVSPPWLPVIALASGTLIVLGGTATAVRRRWWFQRPPIQTQVVLGPPQPPAVLRDLTLTGPALHLRVHPESGQTSVTEPVSIVRKEVRDD